MVDELYDGNSIPNALRMTPINRIRMMAAANRRKYWNIIAAKPTVTAAAETRVLSWRVKPITPRHIPSNPIPIVVGGYHCRRLEVTSFFDFTTNSCPLALATRRSLMFTATSTATSSIVLAGGEIASNIQGDITAAINATNAMAKPNVDHEADLRVTSDSSAVMKSALSTSDND